MAQILGKRKIYKIILLALIVGTVMFIFSNSFAGPAQSSEQSESVADVIRPFLEIFMGKGNVTDHFVRKLAHFGEFAVLGFWLGLYFEKFALLPYFLSLITALSDESIQLFTGRGPSVKDVWLDFSGAACGYAAAILFFMLVCELLKKQRQRKQNC